MEPTLC